MISDLHEAVVPQLDALSLDAGRPLLIVDVDEVIVCLADHLSEFALENAFNLTLTSYKLDGALKRHDGSQATQEEFDALFRAFFEKRTIEQRLYQGADSVLNALAADMQVVILTNVPFYAHEDRIENLRGHGLHFPVIANAGPKGAPLRWLSAQVNAPVAFIDDSPSQLASAAKHAPDVARIHYVGDEKLRGFITPVEDAQHHAQSWAELQTLLPRLLIDT